MAGMSDDEFEALLRLLIRCNSLMRPEFAESLVESIARWRRDFTKSQQKAGLREALNDIVEDSYRLAPAVVDRINAILLSEGLMGLHELRLEHGRRIRRLLKKAKLTREDDVYVLKGMADSGLLSPEDTEKAVALIESFG